MRALSIFALVTLALTSGCRTKRCADGTLFVELHRSGAAASADHLGITALVDTTPMVMGTEGLESAGADSSFVLRFASGYPSGKSVTFTFTAYDLNGNAIASETLGPEKLASGCDVLDVSLSTGATDAAMPTDGGVSDGSTMCVPTVAAMCPTTKPNTTCGAAYDNCGGGMIACPAYCQVNGVLPRLANTGDIVEFEGTFEPGATVSFPGSANPSVLAIAGHRASVNVPADATSGKLTVTSGGELIDAGPFRRAAAQLVPYGYVRAGNQTQAGRVGAKLATPRTMEVMVEYNGWIYVIGGVAGGASLNTVERARVNADGTIGYVEPQIAMNVARSNAMGVVIGNRIYVFGGQDMLNASSTLTLGTSEYADIAPDGTLSAWQTGPALDARASASVHVVGNRVLLAGGLVQTGSGTTPSPTGTIASASFNGGTLSNFVTDTHDLSLATARFGHAGFTTPFGIVVAGGTVSNAASNTVESYKINSDGYVDAPANTPPTLVYKPQNVVGVQWGSTLALWHDTLTDTSKNMGAYVDAELDPGNGRINDTTYSRVVVVRDQLCTLYAEGSGADDTFACAPLQGNAHVGPTMRATPPPALPVALDGYASAVVGNSIYLLGGGAGTAGNTIYRATVSADDSISAFTSAGTIPQALYGAAAFVSQDAVYVVGGTNSGTQSKVVYVAPVDKTDGLGTWAMANSTLLTARDGLRVLVDRDRICAIGGNVGTTPSKIMECATYDHTNGTNDHVPPFANVTDSTNNPAALTVARAYFEAAYTMDGLVAIGGDGSGDAESSTGLVGTNSFAPWAKETDETETDDLQKLPAFVCGPWIYVLGDTSYRGPWSDVDLQSDTASGLGAPKPTNSAAFLIGNEGYVVGGSGSMAVRPLDVTP